MPENRFWIEENWSRLCGEMAVTIEYRRSKLLKERDKA